MCSPSPPGWQQSERWPLVPTKNCAWKLRIVKTSDVCPGCTLLKEIQCALFWRTCLARMTSCTDWATETWSSRRTMGLIHPMRSEASSSPYPWRGVLAPAIPGFFPWPPLPQPQLLPPSLAWFSPGATSRERLPEKGSKRDSPPHRRVGRVASGKKGRRGRCPYMKGAGR